MAKKITKRAIDTLREEAKVAGKNVLMWDADVTGFGAIATKTGTCSYIIQYRLGGRASPSKRMTLGKHGILSPDEARKIARDKLGKVAHLVDVAQVRKDEKEKLTGLTFKKAVERFLSIHEKNTRYWAQKGTRLTSTDTKALASKPIETITRAQIAAVFDLVQARSGAAARHLFADIRPVFAWSLDRGLIEVNPMVGMKAPSVSKSRDRVLGDAEVKAFWQAATEQSWPFENVFKLLLLTGARREEIAGMRWREIDLDGSTWTIARERTKNGKAHTIDLCPQVVAMLAPVGETIAARFACYVDDLVFSTTGTTSVSGFGRVKARIDARMKKILGDRFEPWRTHDLRRTAASGMAGLGFQPQVIERVLNHVSGAQGGLVSVYQRHEYREERKRALLAWDERVAVLAGEKVASSNIVSLHKAVA